MRTLVHIARVLVGLLFIFSGLVKANDPLGLSYKMQEFFEVWGWHGWDNWTLSLSVLMNAFEIIAGTALILGWRIRLFSWLLLLLIVFFTFLTGYTYFTGKPTNCGCFGDCLPISSKTSFLKDVALLVLIAFLCWKRNLIKPFLPAWLNITKMVAVVIFAFGFQWYTLHFLPVVDCLPYKIHNNLAEKMKMPADAVPDSTVITFVYDKKGQTVEFTASQFPADFNGTDYKLIKRYDKLIRKGKNNEPPIKGFNLSGPTDIDSTEFVLTQPYAILLFCENFSVPVSRWQADFEKIYAAAREKNIPCFMITAAPSAAPQAIRSTGFAGMQILKCDYKAIVSAARTNPCIYLVQKGTVVDKRSYHGMDKMLKQVQALPVQPVVNNP